MHALDTDQTPYRCDWCGSPIDLHDGDQLDMSVFDDIEEDVDGVPLDEPVDASTVAEGVADALVRVGGPRDAMLAVTIREEHAYRLHDDCYDATSLDQLYTEEA